jgi:hypothetical protein
LHEPAAQWRNFWRVAAYALAAAVALCVLLALYARIFGAYPLTADQCNVLLAAIDFCHGNWRLSGWTLPPDNFWGLEIPLTALVWSVTHNAVETLRLLPAINLLVLLAAASVLVARTARPGARYALLPLAAFIFLPVAGKNIAFFYAASPCHVLTVACILIEILLAAEVLAVPSRRKFALLAYALIGADAVASDPLIVVLGFVPILGAMWLCEAPGWRGKALIGLASLGAIAVGHFAVLLNTKTGGFQAFAADSTFVDFSRLPASAAIMLRGTLQIFNCDIFGLTVQQRLTQILRIPFLIAVLWTVYPIMASHLTSLKNSGKPKISRRFPETAFVLIVLINLAAMLLSSTINALDTERFLLPAAIATILLFCTHMPNSRALMGYLAVLALVNFGTELQQLGRTPKTIYAPPVAQVTTCLEEAGLTNGFAGYWLASSVVIASDQTITSRAIMQDPSGAIVPMQWLANARWFHNPSRSAGFFVITAPDDRLLPRGAALQAFGTPASSLFLPGAVIDVYGKPINAGICATPITTPKLAPVLVPK